ncbi:MAG: FHA domain-containing protein [Cyanobacteria bacterium P01_A01_bin.105]
MITLSLLHPLNKTPVQHWSFDEESVIRIGRSTDNDVVLYSAVVSRHHVEIRKLGSSDWAVVSLGTNGTYLEGRRIEEVPAEDGLVIRLARSGPNIQINLAAKTRNSAVTSIQDILARRQQLNQLSNAATDIAEPSLVNQSNNDDEPA